MYKMDQKRIDEISIAPQSTIKQAMAAISRGGIGTAFIVDPQSKKFIGLITDGDIRRAILRKGSDLSSSIDVMDRPSPTTAKSGMKTEEISKMFGENIRVIPVIDDRDVIVDVALYDQRVHLPVAAPSLGEKELEYVSDCIVSNWISSTGKYVSKFENMFADYCGSSHAISTSSGTTALHLALLAAGVGKGDEVIVPSFTFISTANAVTYTGATPVFVDSEKNTWNIDPEKIKDAITSRTKVIIPVHLYGHPADMDPIMEIAKEAELIVIEDAAEAHGAEYKGKRVGGIGHIGVFSFYGNKIITTGEGGMLVTSRSDIAEQVKLFRDHGMSQDRRYWHPVLGYNYRMTNLQAAIGVAQVERIDSIIQSKLDIAYRYASQLKGIEGIVCPPKETWAKNVFWLFSILVDESYGITRDALIDELKRMDIDTRPLFPPLHQQPIYSNGQSLPVSEDLSLRGLSLPSSADLEEYEVDRVCNAIKYIQQKVRQSVNA